LSLGAHVLVELGACPWWCWACLHSSTRLLQQSFKLLHMSSTPLVAAQVREPLRLPHHLTATLPTHLHLSRPHTNAAPHLPGSSAALQAEYCLQTKKHSTK
jgi:hypothetical protein